MKRRTFIQGLAATAAAAPIMLNGIPVRAKTSLPFLAQMPQMAQGKVLVFIQLFGGNDGLNTVIPVNQNEYYTLRPNIGILPKDAIEVEPGLIYFNPGLSYGAQGGFTQMLKSGWLTVVQALGYPSPNLSHFRSSDIWLSGINPPNSSVVLDSGWIGRMLEKNYPNFPATLPNDPLAIQLGGFSLTLTGAMGEPTGIQVGIPSKQAGVLGSLDSALNTLDDNATGTDYATEYAFVEQIAASSNKYATNIQNAYASGKAKLTASYGSDSFGQQMASVAALIAGGLQTSVYVVSLGGFDTHVQQQSITDPTQGTQPTLLGQLADGVAEFMYDMVKIGMADNVIGMTVSEFGRRPNENGSYGTDHGAASVQFVWGRQVNSGMIGHLPDLTGELDEVGDTVMQYDYRAIYLDIMTAWFGMTLADANAVLQLPVDQIYPLDVIQVQQGVSKLPQPSSVVGISNYPNPFSSRTTFNLTLPADAQVTFDISNVIGQQVTRLFDRKLEAGVHQIPFDAGAIPSGVYVCTVMVNGQRYSRQIECAR